MDGLKRTGGQDAAAVISAAQKARMERIAEEAAKYKLPGMALGDGPPAAGERPQPIPPQNLAQLRAWVEHSGGSIDILA